MRTFVSTILMQRLPFNYELLSKCISSLVAVKTAMSCTALITQHCWINSWTWWSLRSLPSLPILPFFATSIAQVSRSHKIEVSAEMYSREITEDESIVMNWAEFFLIEDAVTDSCYQACWCVSVPSCCWRCKKKASVTTKAMDMIMWGGQKPILFFPQSLFNHVGFPKVGVWTFAFHYISVLLILTQHIRCL